ncbi:MAG: TetR/AcrR family transcriptional regulator [Deltaproteobacteria bacterium]|nr:TetR/AcrR family transcriptional regulator [Deltaproteobacteria bacterium]
MSEKKLSRREREKLRQRQEMLDAAVKLFSKDGYHNVSMLKIAQEAEFAIGTLYKFFKNKEDLYRSIIIKQANTFHEALTAALEEKDDVMEKLRNYIKSKGSVFMNNVSVVRLYFAETRGASFNIKAGLDKEIREDYEQLMQELAKVFEAGIQQKRFQQIADPYHLAVALESLTNTFLLLWLESPEQHSYPEDPDVILDILCKSLMIKP